MGTTYESRTICVTIDRTPAEVYDFAVRPENLPRWASGLGSAFERAGGEPDRLSSGDADRDGETWIAQTPHGPMKVRFAPRNAFGVLDHTVFPESGPPIRIPLRVVPNGDGSELVFVLFRMPGVSDAEFAADADWVRRDLETLRSLLEASAGPATG